MDGIARPKETTSFRGSYHIVYDLSIHHINSLAPGRFQFNYR